MISSAVTHQAYRAARCDSGRHQDPHDPYTDYLV